MNARSGQRAEYGEHGPKDANEALLRPDCDISEIIRSCTVCLGDANLLTLGDLKDKVLYRIVN